MSSVILAQQYLGFEAVTSQPPPLEEQLNLELINISLYIIT